MRGGSQTLPGVTSDTRGASNSNYSAVTKVKMYLEIIKFRCDVRVNETISKPNNISLNLHHSHVTTPFHLALDMNNQENYLVLENG